MTFAEELFFDAAQELDALAFDAFDELASVASDMELPLQTFEGLTRTGTASPFPVSDPAVLTAFSTEVLELGENSRLIEILDDHVAVLRVVSHNQPQEQALEAVRTEIEAELASIAAQGLADAAAAEFLARAASLPAADSSDADSTDAAVSTDADATDAAESTDAAAEQASPGDAESDREADSEPQSALAALAGELGGTWTERTWLRRTDTGVPPEILSSVFNARPDSDGAEVRERVALAGGDEAVVLMTAIRPGNADSLTRDELQSRLTALAQATAGFELAGYAQHVRDDASVRIPDEVIDPPLF